MRLAFSSNAFIRHSLVETMKIVKDLGYEGLEIMADAPHLWPPDATEDGLSRIESTAASLGLSLCNMNGFMMKAAGTIHHPSWIELDSRERLRRARHTRDCLHLASKLKIPTVSTEPGGPLEKEMDRRTALALFREGIASVLPEAERAGVVLLVEPEPELLLERMEETIGFLDDLDSKALGLNFDAGHFFCVGQDPAELIRRHPDRLEHIHLEDIAADRIHHHLIPGRGVMDFKAIFSALHAAEYRGFVTVELYPYEEDPRGAAEEAIRFLEPFLKG